MIHRSRYMSWTVDVTKTCKPRLESSEPLKTPSLHRSFKTRVLRCLKGSPSQGRTKGAPCLDLAMPGSFGALSHSLRGGRNPNERSSFRLTQGGVESLRKGLYRCVFFQGGFFGWIERETKRELRNPFWGHSPPTKRDTHFADTVDICSPTGHALLAQPCCRRPLKRRSLSTRRPGHAAVRRVFCF